MTTHGSELAVSFACGKDTLQGIISPGADQTSMGVVIVVGGPQYRVGSHRQFVQLARAIAQRGFPVLRFDVRGMGDSTGDQRSFDSLDEDIGAAIDALQDVRPSVNRVALWGLCDGASAALLYLHRRTDPRVAGLALLNPWVRSEASLARTHVKHYYVRRLMEANFWAKLLRGGVGLPALAGLVSSLRAMATGGSREQERATEAAAPFQQRMAEAWGQFAGDILLMISENDLTAREFEETAARSRVWRRAIELKPPHRLVLAGADHTCSTPQAASDAESATLDWLRALTSSVSRTSESTTAFPV